MKRVVGLVLVCCAAAACNTGDASNPISADTGAGKGTVVELGGLKSQAPSEWEKQKPASSLRLLQFRVPHADNDPEDAELVIFYFDGGGGGLEDNRKRWQQKFIAPKGKTIDEVTKVDKFKVGDHDSVLVDIRGTYLFQPPGKGDVKKEQRPDYRMLAVILGTSKGPYFITLIGPQRTVEQREKAFVDWVKNFK